MSNIYTFSDRRYVRLRREFNAELAEKRGESEENRETEGNNNLRMTNY
jgi:hypothetical protein